MKKVFYFLILHWVLILRIFAQDNTIKFTYTTEIQSNINDKINWLNLLSVSGNVSTEYLKLWKKGLFTSELISFYKQDKHEILIDRQVFSNIETDNLPIGISFFGYLHTFKKSMVCAGIRNMNKDYIITPYTSFFTNSSAGLFPTLSANFPLPSYPLSAMGLHAEYDLSSILLLKTSIYNGVAYSIREHWGSVFTIHPKKDGVFMIAEMTYSQTKIKNGLYCIGIAGLPFFKKLPNYTFWINTEQRIYNTKQIDIGMLAQFSYAFLNRIIRPNENQMVVNSAKANEKVYVDLDNNFCKVYWAVGTVFSGIFSKGKKDELGIYINSAQYLHLIENSVEVSWSYTFPKYVAIQPAYHFIHSGKNKGSVLVLRFILTV